MLLWRRELCVESMPGNNVRTAPANGKLTAEQSFLWSAHGGSYNSVKIYYNVISTNTLSSGIEGCHLNEPLIYMLRSVPQLRSF